MYFIILLLCKTLKKSYYATFRKQTCSIIYKKLPLKTENFQIKNSDSFHISAKNRDFGYSLEPPWRGGSNEYPQYIVLSRNKKNIVYPC